MKAIASEAEYKVAIAIIETFISKGFANLTRKEEAELKEILIKVAAYEAEHYPIL